MRFHHQRFIPVLAILAFAAATAAADVGPTYAIRNCRIVPVAGPPIAKGIIVIRDGLIEAVGPLEKVAAPPDAEVIEAEGLVAYPGLVVAHTNLFLEVPPPAAAEARPAAFPLTGQATAPAEDRFPPGPGQLVLSQLKFKKSTFESWHKAGVTTVLVAPYRGIFQGQSVLLNLNGEALEPMVLRQPLALHVNFTVDRRTYPSSLMGTIAYLRQSFLDAGHYAAHQAQFDKLRRGLKRPAYDPFLEALVPFVRDRRPVVFQCNNQEDIKRALKIIAEFKLQGMIAGANEAWRVAAELKASKVPLLVTLNLTPPTGSQYVTQGEELKKKAEAEIYPANAANLVKEGIPFALTALGLVDGAALTKNALTAVKAGLPKDKALEALTILAARALGVDRELGSLEPGKIANVILTKGELFEEKTTVDRVFADGVMFKF
ncbi:MAG: amidohydrolase family protein [Candidatus Aminicenantes bacterium]|nr:amidohydrolase family protein [Candidatus Aminicenantes bacterium]